jgi:hypothetical protein
MDHGEIGPSTDFGIGKIRELLFKEEIGKNGIK